MEDTGEKHLSKNTLKKRRQRANLKTDPNRLAAHHAKDAERKCQQRKAVKAHLEQHPRLMAASKLKKKLEMREYRRKKMATKETEDTELESKRSTAAKEREAKKKDRKRKAAEQLTNKLASAEKKKATQSWRLKVKLKDPRPEQDRNAEPFASSSSEIRAVRKARGTLPETPRRKARVLQKLINSPATGKILQEKGVTLSKKTRRSLEMGEEVIHSLKEQIDSVKPVGGTRSSQGAAYQILRSVVDKKKKKRISGALLAKLKLRKGTQPNKIRRKWWEPKSRIPRKDRIQDSVKQRVKNFYLSSEISREVPDKRAAIKIKDGTKVRMVQRHNMAMTLGDAFVVYKKMYPDDKIGLTAFSKLRPRQ